MNKKQVFKFVILAFVLSFIYTFLAGIVYGIFSAFSTDMKMTLSISSLILNIITFFVTLLAIATSAKLTYKKAPIAKEDIKKLAVITTVFNLIISFLFSSFSVDLISFIYIVIDVALTYFATIFFVKKYSI